MNELERNRRMKTLRMNLKNDLRGLWLEEHDDMRGFILRDAPDGTAMYTAYVSENGYSSYYGVADDKGYDLADERPLAENVPSVFTAVAKIKAHQLENGDKSYREACDYIDTDFRSIDCWRY